MFIVVEHAILLNTHKNNMSLKAYNGMMTRKGLSYIQEETLKRLPQFKEASLNHISKSYADFIIKHVDEKYSVIDQMKFEAHNESSLLEKIKKIEIDDNTTLLSYLFQSSKILSLGNFVNDFTAHLNIAIESKLDKILIYPNILVDEHKKILLEYLDDWYCQNQCDQDENVPSEEWEERTKDWYDFENNRGFSIKISLFNPNDSWNSLNEQFRGDELYERILNFIPKDEKRKRRIAKELIIAEKCKGVDRENINKVVFNTMYELSEENNTEISDYINSNEIELTKIDTDFLKIYKLKNPS